MKKGFTLIEMIVAVGVFTMAITIALAAFLNISDIQRKANSFRAVSDGLNFAMETMVREIRMGTNYSIAGGGTNFSFTNSNGNIITYGLNGTMIEVSIDGGAPITLTDPTLEITRLLFVVKGEAAGDNFQPMVTIILSGVSGEKEKTETRLNLQTTISQREFDS